MRPIATVYRFCPYCGVDRVRRYEFRAIARDPSDRVQPTVAERSAERLRRIEERLACLETDLDAFLVRSPRHSSVSQARRIL